MAAIAAGPLLHLLERDPELGRFLGADEVEEATRVVVAVGMTAAPGPWALPLDWTGSPGCFGALLLSGLLTREVEVAGQRFGLVLGPGDVIAATDAGYVANDTTLTVRSTAQLALLDDRFLTAVRRWPALTAGLVARSGEQLERLAIAHVIGQLPKVEMRVLGMLWQLAERWGRVSPSGVVLPMALTHELLSHLVGARRPTVTLALKELIDRGAVVRRPDRSWLLVEPGPEPVATVPSGEELDSDLLVETRSGPPAPLPVRRPAELVPREEMLSRRHAELLESLARLRASHQVRLERIRDERARLEVRRAAHAELFRQIRTARLARSNGRPPLKLVSEAGSRPTDRRRRRSAAARSAGT